jgi:hypothetical protein
VQTQRRRADGRCGVVSFVERSRGATGATAEAERRRVHAEVKLRYVGICRFAVYHTSASLISAPLNHRSIPYFGSAQYSASTNSAVAKHNTVFWKWPIDPSLRSGRQAKNIK